MNLNRFCGGFSTYCIPNEDSNPELHQLVTKYQYHKCSGYCQRREKVKGTYRPYNPSKENEGENDFYSLLLLFVPFRNEIDMTEEGESAEGTFNRHMKENDALNTHSEKLQMMLEARE